MFSSSDQEAVSFDSSWKTEKLISEKNSQTQVVDTFEKESQATFKSEACCQTDKEESPKYSSVEENDFKILSFLQRIAPKVEEELERSFRSRAFDGYSLLDENSEVSAKRLHTLRCSTISPEHSAIDISWSCTGSVIAVGYGVKVHDDWCSHKSTVAVWNINRKEFTANAPDHVMEVATCVTSLSFHPRNPALLAVGNMAGEVMVYDLSQSLDAVPLFRGDSGGVSISTLVWTSSEGLESFGGSSRPSSAPILVCLTTEGTVLFWVLHHDKAIMSLSAGFLVKSEEIPRESRLRSSDNRGLGLTSISFAYDDPSRFLLGTENGSILLCSTSLMERSNKSVNDVALKKCIVSSLAPHDGRVLDIAFSKFHRHAVLSLGSDKNLRLYSLLQTSKPLKIISSEDSLTCAQWLPSRPLIVAAGKACGGVALFSFVGKDFTPVLELSPSERPSPISTLAFNNNNLKLVACGDHLGRVFLWELPDSLLSAPVYESLSLEELVQSALDQ